MSKESKLPHVKVVLGTSASVGSYVELNGEKLHGVQKITIVGQVNTPTRVIMEVIPSQVEVDVDVDELKLDEVQIHRVFKQLEELESDENTTAE